VQELTGRVAVVTGAASGIGRAVAERLGGEGMRLVLADIEEGPLTAVVDALDASGVEVTWCPTDVSDHASVVALRDHALERFGAVHLVHNNAGVGGSGGPIWTVPLADWRWTLDVNLWGVIYGIHVFVPLLVDQGEGHVVNTASLAGLCSPPFMGPYNATKHAVVTISETLFKDLRSVGSPVGVSVLCPGFVKTGIARSGRNRPDWAPAPSGAASGQMDDVLSQLVAGGIAPAAVAAELVEAVRHDRFYAITHPETDAMVSARFHEVVDRQDPSVHPIG